MPVETRQQLHLVAAHFNLLAHLCVLAHLAHRNLVADRNLPRAPNSKR